MENGNVTTTIRLSRDTKARIDSLGKKNESYDDVLGRILDIFEFKRADEIIEAKCKK